MKKYYSVIAMVKDMSSRQFFVQFLYSQLHKHFSDKKIEKGDISGRKRACYEYQCYCKIYLDEYPEQKELREKLGSKLVLSRMINYMLENATFTETCDTVPLITITSLQNTIAVLKDNYDQYFYNRWIKRN